jgi:hypothetical protein
MYLSPYNTCVKSEIGYFTLSSYEQKPPPFSQYSSPMGHNMLCKQVTKKAISGKCAFKDFWKMKWNDGLWVS